MDAWVADLLAWYRSRERPMPWRGHPDPYAVWVSEIMLQQTQVETVRPYFTRFLAAFPDIPSLAAAEDEPLLKAWEGLGYYTRVRNLRKAAQRLMAEHGGALPRTVEGLRALPGVGDYTAAAIASICFGLPVPVVDGNVARVFARRNLLDGDFHKPAPRRALADWLTPHIAASGDPAAFNQAMMDLGAQICTPRNPRCDDCPLCPTCQAAEQGRQADFPAPPPAKTLPERTGAALLLRDAQGRLLLAKHPGDRLLAGFWELPAPDTLPFPKLHPLPPDPRGPRRQTLVRQPRPARGFLLGRRPRGPAPHHRRAQNPRRSRDVPARSLTRRLGLYPKLGNLLA